MIKNIFLAFCTFVSLGLLAQDECAYLLPGEGIETFAEDANYVWLGTAGNGLCRMDKATFEKTYFTTDNSDISSNYIKSMFVDENWLYIGTDISFLRLHLDDLSMEMIDDSRGGLIAKSPNGYTVLVDNVNMYFYYVDSPSPLFETIPITDAILKNNCCSEHTALEIDQNGDIWIAHHDFYFYTTLRYATYNTIVDYWEVYTSKNSPTPIESFQQNSIAIDNENKMWAGNWGGIQQFNNQDYPNSEWATIASAAQPLANETDTLFANITSLATGAGDRMWVGSRAWSYWNPVTAMSESESGKIGYYEANEWHQLPDFSDSLFNVKNMAVSTFDSDILYVGTDKGLVIANISCIELITGLETGATDHQNGRMQIFPNPATANTPISIKIDNISYCNEVELVIRDVSGAVVHHKIYPVEHIEQIEVGPFSLHAGLYFVEVWRDDKQSVEQLIVSE